MSHTSIDCSVAGVAVEACCLRVLMRLLWRPTTDVARITPAISARIAGSDDSRSAHSCAHAWSARLDMRNEALKRGCRPELQYEGRETPYRRNEEDESGLKELDGQLRFPGRRGRR